MGLVIVSWSFPQAQFNLFVSFRLLLAVRSSASLLADRVTNMALVIDIKVRLVGAPSLLSFRQWLLVD